MGSIRRRATIALAVSTVTGAMLLPGAAQASAVQGPSSPQIARQCVSLTRNYISGASRYAVAKNICSGTYRVRFVRSFPWPSSSCFTIRGHQTVTKRVGGSFSGPAKRTAYC